MQTRFRETIRRKTNNRFFSDCAVFSTQHLNSPLLLESLTVFFKMCCGNNCLWSVIKMCLIIYEILDKYVDTATAVEYHKGKLFHKPKDSVYRALLAFTIIGCFNYLLFSHMPVLLGNLPRLLFQRKPRQALRRLRYGDAID